MRKQDKMGGSDSRAPLRLGRSVVRPTKPPCYAGYIGGGGGEWRARTAKRLHHLSFQGPTALYASKQGEFCTVRPFHAWAHWPSVLVYWPASA